MSSMAMEHSLETAVIPPRKHLHVGFPWESPSIFSGPLAPGQAQFLNMEAAEEDSESDSELDHLPELARAPEAPTTQHARVATVKRVNSSDRAPSMEQPLEHEQAFPQELHAFHPSKHDAQDTHDRALGYNTQDTFDPATHPDSAPESEYVDYNNVPEETTLAQYDYSAYPEAGTNTYAEETYAPERYGNEGYHQEGYYQETYANEAYNHETHDNVTYNPEAYGTETQGDEILGNEAYGAAPHLDAAPSHDTAPGQDTMSPADTTSPETPVRRGLSRKQRNVPGAYTFHAEPEPMAEAPQQDVPSAQPDKSIKNTASRFLKKVIPPRAKRSTDMPAPNAPHAEEPRTPTSPKLKPRLRELLRPKHTVFPVRTPSQERELGSCDPTRGPSMDNPLLSNEPVADPSSDAALQPDPRTGAASPDAAPAFPGAYVSRGPSPYYTNAPQQERSAQRPRRRAEKPPQLKGNLFQTLFKKRGASNAPAPDLPKSEETPHTQEEPMPYQFEQRRRESMLRARRRSRSVGAFEAPEPSDAPKTLGRVPVPAPSEELQAPRRSYAPSTPASHRDSFATAHSETDGGFPDAVQSQLTSQPNSPGGSMARESQRFSQSTNSRLSDSMFSQSSQSTAPTSMAPSSSNLSKPLSLRERGAPPPSAAKHQSMSQFQPSALPSSVREVPTPGLGTVQDDEEQGGASKCMHEPPTWDTTPMLGSNKRLSLGLNDDSWLLDLDFERSQPEKHTPARTDRSLSGRDAPSRKEASQAPVLPDLSLSGLDAPAPQKTSPTPVLPNGRLLDEEAPLLDLPESLNFSSMLVDYL